MDNMYLLLGIFCCLWGLSSIFMIFILFKLSSKTKDYKIKFNGDKKGE